MITAGIMIDDWKFPIFKKRLTDTGYSFTKLPGITKDTLLLQVETESLESLKLTVEKINAELRKINKHRH